MKHRRSAALCAVLFLSWVAPAAAQEDADSLIHRGVEMRRQGHDAEALDTFTRALAIQASPRALAQVALAEQALGQWVAAESRLVAALANEDDPWIAGNREPLEAALATIRRHLAAIVTVPQVPPPSGVLVERSATHVAAPEGRGAEHTLAYGLIAAGAASLAATAALSVLILVRKQTVTAHCPDRQCDDEGYAAGTEGRAFATAGTVTFAVGATALATGTILLLTSRAPGEPPSREPGRLSFAVAPSSNGTELRVAGAF